MRVLMLLELWVPKGNPASTASAVLDEVERLPDMVVERARCTEITSDTEAAVAELLEEIGNPVVTGGKDE